PDALAPVPGRLADRLIFTVEAHDAAGRALGSLPAEANLNVRYRASDVAGLNEAGLGVVELEGGGRPGGAGPRRRPGVCGGGAGRLGSGSWGRPGFIRPEARNRASGLRPLQGPVGGRGGSGGGGVGSGGDKPRP